MKKPSGSGWLAITATALTACGNFPNPGNPPALTPLELTMHAPTLIGAAASAADPGPGAWGIASRGFFGDGRARFPGDILTVTIEIADSAQVNNTTSRTRSNSEDLGVQALFGAEKNLGTTDPVFGLDSGTTLQGTGAVNRAEKVNLTIAAEVVQRLGNNNLIIAGRQEVLVNNEVRELLVTGIVRPADISPTNTIAHTRIAQARISYGGRGDLSVVQRPRFGFRLWNKLSPF